jgi:hypothetical protein
MRLLFSLLAGNADLDGLYRPLGFIRRRLDRYGVSL